MLADSVVVNQTALVFNVTIVYCTVRLTYTNMDVSTNISEFGDSQNSSSQTSCPSGHASIEDDSEELSPSYPSLNAPENEFIRSSLNLTTSAGLKEAVEKCKELVLESEEWSEERRWLVHHLLELRMRFKEVEEIESAPQVGDGNILNSMKEENVVLGHHFFLQAPSNSTARCCCCSGFIWSFLNHFYQCRDCPYRCHVKCLTKVRRLCTNVSLLQSPTYISEICPEVGLSAQHFSCFECKAHITFTFPSSVSWYGWPFSSENSLVEPRQCDYDGNYYCSKCHWNNTAIIPARVIHNWDFIERPVCCRCSDFLKLMFSKPIIKMDQQNPQLFGLVEELSNTKKLRSELLLMKQYLTNCPDALKKRLVWCLRPHFVDCSPGLFSLEDLLELQRGELFTALRQAALVFTNHIKVTCQVCRGKGYYCQICISPEPTNQTPPIFPFDEMVSTCAKCCSVFHRTCWLMRNEECPKCKRIQNREKLNDPDSDAI